MTSQPLSTVRQLELLRDLQLLANERREAELRLQSLLEEGDRKAREEFERCERDIAARYEEAKRQAEARYLEAKESASRRYETERNETQQRYKSLRHEVESEYSKTTQAALAEEKEVSWETLAVFEATEGRPAERLKDAVRRLNIRREELAVLERDVLTILEMRRQRRLPQPPSESPEGRPAPRFEDADEPAEAAIEHVDKLTQEVRQAAIELHAQQLPQLFEGWYPFGTFLAAWALAAVPSGLWFGWDQWQWIAVSGGVAVLVSGALLSWLYPIARRESIGQFQIIQRLLKESRQGIQTALHEAKQRTENESEELAKRRDEELAGAQSRLKSLVGEKEGWKQTELGGANSTFPTRLAELRSHFDNELATLDRQFHQALAEATEEHDRLSEENQKQLEENGRHVRSEYEMAQQDMAQRWHQGWGALQDAWQEISQREESFFPNWSATDWNTWQPPNEPPSAIRFGEVSLNLKQVKHGIPLDEKLRPPNTTLTLPALMTLEEHPVLAISAENEGRAAAIDVLELVMLRILTAMPPGKVRFTILDPVGLGENFASFMHLADTDERLIASRIWTEGTQIEEQLRRLTNHMETVLQKYLRNEFATIYDYNEHAGEVAEPFQILVAANFPANFSEAAARRLVSITTSGPRCGVYTLLSIDTQARLPNEFHLDDLLEHAVHLEWQPGEQRFRWNYPAFEKFPLTIDSSPPADQFNEIVRASGRKAKDALKVEVPFSVVAPAEDELWQGDNSRELVVPIGRAGATRLQSARLGLGTAQHMLICGKTGSGKSTLLHALITSTVLHYNPDQVELYLIDFKKGVEFKTYATHRLPHARVVAIESEREFGLSVLERLDEELKTRGDLFRQAAVQDLAGFRAVNPKQPMPRVLLVVDEFQELFVEDDQLAQEAALLLDRLVRQGRAFGIHILLGSQTLSGAYSIARSTMGQMGVRVALQCSEADAHLILSDERNLAARYLSRPGEAIYNDQNGLLAGNHPFQVVWLPDPERNKYLDRVEELAQSKGDRRPPPIVFEGTTPADPSDNPLLQQALAESPGPPRAAGSTGSANVNQRAWLGDAVAIKDPTSAIFGRGVGSNLLVVGQREESSLGVLTAAVISLAAQNPASGDKAVRFVIADGTREDSPLAGTWQKLADALPHSCKIVGPNDLTSGIVEVAQELARRDAIGEQQAPPIYLVIYNGSRFRELRRSDDDLGFSFDKDKPASADKLLAEILRNGPALGIHTLVWCDGYNSVTRLFDRMTLREFGMRVAFQMSAADSSNLLDTPAASRLRVHRGLFYSEDFGTQEKFRPYGPPTDEWLAEVRKKLAARSAQ